MTTPTNDPRYSSDVAVPGLTIIGNGPSLDVTRAITAGTFVRPVSGAITLDLTLRDPDPRRSILNDPILASPFYATLYDLRFEGTAVGKRGSDVQVTFVDGIAAALNRRRGLLTIPASTQTRAQIAKRLCDEIGVQVLVDPEDRGVVNSVVERKGDVSSWDVLSNLADDAGWRRLSDGRRVYLGSDAWLASLSSPVAFREFTGPVHTIDFSLDVATPANRCALDVDAELWSIPAGRPFTVEGLGLASGAWVVEEFRRDVFRTRATVTGTRRQLVIPEPLPSQTATAGESGEVDFVADPQSLTTPPAGKYGGTNLTGVQVENAVRIVRVGLQRNLGRQGCVVALSTALQESSLVNLAGGDRDSVGLFQQRPSQGWGTAAQCRNPEYAAGKFYDALVKVSGWQSLAVTVAAQKVQRSAFPDAYAKWVDEAEALYAAIVKAGSAASTTSAGGSGTSAGSSGASRTGSTSSGLDKIADLAVALASKGLPYVFGGKGPGNYDCSGFVAKVTRDYGRELSGGSKQQWSTAKAKGVACSAAEALRTRGAILFRMVGDPTHVAISLGDGRTAEARGTQYGVKVFDGAFTRQWTGGAKWQ